ncbi:MAG: hypothetical protein L0Y71_13045 [Gemmataceae bacterium]|nr:hypothetical protein [Gemmataceae bacterium]
MEPLHSNMDSVNWADDYGDGPFAADDIADAYAGMHADARHAVVGYVPSRKAHARTVCTAFVQGAGGVVRQPPPKRLVAGAAAAFFGVIDATQHLWQEARAEGRDWYYLDNAYFDAARGRLYRATKNAVQSNGRERPDWKRWAALGVQVRPWRKQGRHVILVAQSQTYMRVVAGYPGWWRDALAVLKRHTDRPIAIRGWRANKMALATTLKEALRDCWALVTWSSAAANEALLAGVPVFTAGVCAATPMGLSDLTRIESPIYPEGRTEWAAGLAGRQWSLDEFRGGTTWRTLNGLGR